MELSEILAGSLRGGNVGSSMSRTARDCSPFTNAHTTSMQTTADEERRLIAQAVSEAKDLPALRTKRFSTERAVAQFLLESLFDGFGQFVAICQDAARELVSQGHILFDASFQEQTPAQVPQTSTNECSNAVAMVQAQPPVPNAPSGIPVIKIEDSDEDGLVDLNNDAIKKFWVRTVISKYEELGLSATVRHFRDRVEAQIYVCDAMTGRIQLPVFKYHDSWTAFSILCREAFEELVLKRYITFPTGPVEQTVQPPKVVSKSSSKKKSVTAKEKAPKKTDKLADEWMERLLNCVTSQIPLSSCPRMFCDRDAALNFLVESVRARFQLPSLNERTEHWWASLCQTALNRLKTQGHIDFPTRKEKKADRAMKKAASGNESSLEDNKWAEVYKSGWNDGHERGHSEGYHAGRADAYAEAMQQLLQRQTIHGHDGQGTNDARNQTTEAIKLTSGPFIAGANSRQSSTGANIFNDLANGTRYRSPALESLSTHEGSVSPSSPHRCLEPPFPNHAVFQNATGFAAYSSASTSFSHPSFMRFTQPPRGLSVLTSGAGQVAFTQPGSTSRKRSLAEVDGGNQASPDSQKIFLR